MFWKSWILTFDPVPYIHQGGQAQTFDQKSGLIYFLFIVPQSAFDTVLLHLQFPLICNMTAFRKKWILTFWGGGRGRGAAGKIFATMLLHWRFPSIWYATCFLSKKVDFWPPGGMGSAGIFFFATMLLHPWFPFIWYATWPCSEKFSLTFWPHPLCPSRGRAQAFGQKSRLMFHFYSTSVRICYHVAAFPIPFDMQHDHVLKKSWVLTPTVRGGCLRA